MYDTRSNAHRERELNLLGAALNLADDAAREVTRYPLDTLGYDTLDKIAAAPENNSE